MSDLSDSSSDTWNLFKGWFSGGLANAVSSSILNPLDIIKTRMQADIFKKASILKTGSLLYREVGLLGLWKPGLKASVCREFLYSGPRAGLYVPVRDFINNITNTSEKNESLLCKTIAALITGTSCGKSYNDT